ncbi:MAG: hypothetical protein ACLSTO_11160 [Bilophila wadsworthia]
MSQGAHDGRMPRRRDRRVPVRAFRAADVLGREPEPSFTTVVQMDMASRQWQAGKGHRHSRSQPARHGQSRCRRPKRQAFLRYLDDIDGPCTPGV